ncbi:monovalent cation/H(+) antiporter subunit G [Marinactinospora thermotolerans]|uniref:Multisubunit sodium/proton antiporter, MrpG subunit n=1 Tax=Marinactinospora thermotolerans DSM 45154 TaxID=1122192 RepID=A0A1T4TEN3_9ACTN|nr:monovalent cation/H(+) antiporter subunit G [Marinactinospora thermotolerans]SKA38934.1 multisubunit sodium/proton antiporter, MrpG subunit [Marinactinospora thermotolerans DSM 45154]
MTHQVIDWIAVGCLLTGALLSFAAGVGLVRFPDLLSRMHTAAKPQVLGLILILIGIGLRMWPESHVGVLVLIALFQILTVPVAGHIAGRVAYRTGRVRHDLIAVDDLQAELEGDGGTR